MEIIRQGSANKVANSGVVHLITKIVYLMVRFCLRAMCLKTWLASLVGAGSVASTTTF